MGRGDQVGWHQDQLMRKLGGAGDSPAPRRDAGVPGPSFPLSRFVASAMLAGALLLAGFAAFEATWRWYGHRLLKAAAERLTLYESSLDAAVERFRYLPEVIALTDPVREVLDQPHDPRRVTGANTHLASVARAAGADVLFVVDAEGLTLASSNADEPTSFVGQRYDFRPYFRDAMRTGSGRYYAVGATTGKPGYFLASRIDGPAGAKGVAVVKVDLMPIETEWRRAGERVALVDGEGVVFLASDPAWRYRPLAPLTAAALRHLDETRQYGAPPQLGPDLTGGTTTVRGLPMVKLAERAGGGETYFDLRRTMTSHGWGILHLVPVRDVEDLAGLVAVLAVIAGLAGLFAVVALRQRRANRLLRDRAHAELEGRVAARTEDLAAMNARLVGEITERTRTEAELRTAQDGLVQSAKLAGLGQALAGIAHEMAQPLAAMRTSLASLRHHVGAGDSSRALASAGDLSAITDRVATLAAQLRNFARPDREKPRPASLQDVVTGALSILDHRLRATGVSLERSFPEQPVMIEARVNRLEQVVVNLVANALDSIEDAGAGGAKPRGIRLVWTVGAQHVELAVEDEGAGLAPGDVEQLFEPFISTKAAGRGLGLGLSISRAIMREQGGDLRLEPGSGGGARAVMSLPLASVKRKP